MAESVIPVEGVAYSAAAFDDIFEVLGVKGDAATQGVFRSAPGVNNLAVTGTSSPVAVASGWALVKGKLYKNTTNINVAIPTPAANPRIDRIVLRLDFTATPMTCTIERLAGAEAASPSAPALTQTDGTTWELPLAQCTITTGGVITVVNDRAYVGDDHIYAENVVANQIGNTELRQSAGLSVIGRSANSTGNVADIVAANDAEVLRRSGTSVGFGTVAAAGIADGACLAEILDDDGAGSGLDADMVDGMHASDVMSGGVPIGTIVMFYGTLGGSDGHRAVPAGGGAANESWHLCNGDTVGGIVTPNMADRFPVAAGSTYAKGATGGVATNDLTHGHSATGLNIVSGGNHTHGVAVMPITTQSGTGASPGGTSGDTTTDGAHVHTVNGTVANSTGQTAIDNKPPYLGVYFMMRVA